MTINDFARVVIDVNNLLNNQTSLTAWLESHEKTLNILVNKSNECPHLVWFYPKKKTFRNWLSDPFKMLLTESLMLVFVCPVTLNVVDCGPNGDGWEVTNPKKWVKKWGPAILFTVKLLQLALVAGRILGLPVPAAPEFGNHIEKKLMQATLSSMANVFSSEMETALKTNSETDLDNAIGPEYTALSGDAYKDIHTFLTTGANAQLGPLEVQLDPHMFRCKGEDGEVEWISAEARPIWEDRHREGSGRQDMLVTQSSSPSPSSSSSAAAAASSMENLKGYLVVKSADMNLTLAFEQIDKILQASRTADVTSKDAFINLTKNELNDLLEKVNFSSGAKANVRAIHAAADGHASSAAAAPIDVQLIQKLPADMNDLKKKVGRSVNSIVVISGDNQMQLKMNRSNQLSDNGQEESTESQIRIAQLYRLRIISKLTFSQRK